MYAIRSYYAKAGRDVVGVLAVTLGLGLVHQAAAVITSYSIHYTKLYDLDGVKAGLCRH